MENSAILREWFDRVDSEKTGNITPIQLKGALAVGNLEFPLTVVEQMIRMYDFDRNGTMSFGEFVALNKYLIKVQHAFSDLERGRGFLVPDDVYEGLIKVGFSLDTPAFYTVCEKQHISLLYYSLFTCYITTSKMDSHIQPEVEVVELVSLINTHFFPYLSFPVWLSSSLPSRSILRRALIKRRMESSVWMTLCHFVYLCSLLGISSLHLIQRSKGESASTSISLSTALLIAVYEPLGSRVCRYVRLFCD